MKSYAKLIGCGIHKYIKVSALALKIIDTKEFQRLRQIKQLGTISFVFPSATHTRFEHSLGVYHLTNKVTSKLLSDYPDQLYHVPELSSNHIKLDSFIAELICLGGLCHDIGHGPFSHMFDEFLMDKIGISNQCVHHEHRSGLLVEKICKRECPELNLSHINFIKSVINPGVNDTGAIYQIVNNYLNGIDVDKFDYLARDTHIIGMKEGFDIQRIIGDLAVDDSGNIVYIKNCASEIYNMFHTRYMMHKQVYGHKVGIVISFMIRDIFEKLDGIFGISKSVNDMDLFIKFTDTNIFEMLEQICDPILTCQYNFSELDKKNVLDAWTIYQNIINRKLYKVVAETTNGTDEIFHKFINILREKQIDTSCLVISSSKIGYVSGNKNNPFDSIYFYGNKKSRNSFLMKKEDISITLQNQYQEMHHLLICKDREIYDKVMDYYEFLC